MPKNTTPIRLVKSPNQWSELNETVRECVSTLCARYDDQDQVRSFLTLLDLMSNVRYVAGDREMVAWEAMREGFRYTKECDEAQERYMGSLVMPTQERKTA